MAVGPNMINYDDNFLMKVLKKCLLNIDHLNLIPLFYVNSQEDYKDETK